MAFRLLLIINAYKLADSVTQAQWAQKYSEAQAAGTRATKLELAGVYDQAFQTYVQAAQAYLFLIRHTQDGETKAKLRGVSNKLVERAEKIKQVKKGTIGVPKKDRFAIEEQDSVLNRSSLLDGQRLPRWTEGSERTIDAVQLFRRPTLSSNQQARACTWKRAREVLPDACIAKEETNGRSILQDNVSDCSLVAALIVAAEHHAKFGSKLGISCLYPQNASGLPTMSQEGLYNARFLINGTWRKITIDDNLPTSIEGELMCASTSTKDEIWPALIEKAYLSLSGTYDFHGSNSANDLYTLSGWLPEHLSLRSSFRSEQVWTRLSNAFQLGKCVLTVGTSKVLDAFLENAGLTPLHNYAVLDLREHKGCREVEIMNPWAEPHSSWSSDLRAALPGQSRRQTLVVPWEELSIHFSTIHVNWDPSVFDFSDTVHLSLDPTESPSLRNRHSTTLRVSIESSSASCSRLSDIWFFVARHSRSKSEKGEFLGLQVSRSLESSLTTSVTPSVDGASTMTDDLYTLHRFTNTSNASLFDVNISHEGVSNDFSFTLSVFSNDRVRIQDGSTTLLYAANVSGSWSGLTAGGNHTRSTFLYNPQYRVTLSPAPNRATSVGDLEIYTQTSKDTPINAKLLVSNGQRIGDFENRDVLTGAASYSYGRQSSSVRGLKPGTYTLVVSSFQPLHEDTFELALRSSLPLRITPVPPEGAGMYSRVVKGAWIEGLDGGSHDLRRNPKFKLELTRPTTLKLRLQTPERPYPIAVQIFEASGNGVSRRPSISSEPYSDLVCGVVTASTKLEPSASGYLIIPTTFTPHTHASFVLYVYADSPINLTEL